VGIASHLEAEILTQSDPTDHALAAIASILDHTESHREPEKAVEEKPIAPGPIAAIRFKWTVRRETHGEYYVDETIGDTSIPVIAGPMTNDAAIRFVDDSQNEARQRFEQLKSEMTGRSAAANVAQNDTGEM